MIGRSEPAQLILDRPEISRQHALVYCDPSGNYLIEDLGSTQGTYLNKSRLQPCAPHPLKAGDVIQIGFAFLQLEPNESDERAETVPQKAKGHGSGVAQTDAFPGPPVRELRNPANTTHPFESRSKEGVQPSQPKGASATVPRIEARQAPAAPSASAPRRSFTPQIREILNNRVDLQRIHEEALDDKQAREIVCQQIRYIVLNEFYQKGTLTEDEVPQVEKEAIDDILGFGPLQVLMDDPVVSEVMVNDPTTIYYETKGKLYKSDRFFLGEEHTRQVLYRMLRASQRRIDESAPTVNAMLEDGSRLHAVLPPIALDGTKITIRKFHHNLGLDELIRLGTMTRAMTDFLKLAVQERQNIVVAGGTGSGKTTLLNLLSAFIPADQRIVTIEDTAELRLDQPHVVRLQSRPANTEGVGKVSIQDLVVEALRMRPDRIVVGECRHAEALDMLQAMNTGHDGSLTTVHANNARDALARLETMVLMAGLDLPHKAVREQIRSAVQLIVHQNRFLDGSRRVTEIVEVTALEEDQIVIQPVFGFEVKSVEGGKVQGHHRPTGYIPTFLDRMKRQGKQVSMEMLYASE